VHHKILRQSESGYIDDVRCQTVLLARHEDSSEKADVNATFVPFALLSVLNIFMSVFVRRNDRVC